uniref:Putative basic tail protein n=1 Tax=Ixodes ricinus TaxID=34613 RepID=A0A0K8R444_IXORI
MKLGIPSSLVIIVVIASTSCQFPDLHVQWPRRGNFTIKHGCPMGPRTEEYGPGKRPGSCFGGACYLILETVTDVTSSESTQIATVENETTPTPPVETENTLTTQVGNGTAVRSPVGN